MSPEHYTLHRERVLWLSEHPLIDGDQDFAEIDDAQATLRGAK